MGILSFLLKKKQSSLRSKEDEAPKTSSELISKLTNGANLVDGMHTWELAEEMRHDIETMKRCCNAELEIMDKAGVVPAPYYFERVAILSRKEKNYNQEIFYCEQYIKKIEAFYLQNGTEGITDVRKGPTYQAILKRLPKARELSAKLRN